MPTRTGSKDLNFHSFPQAPDVAGNDAVPVGYAGKSFSDSRTVVDDANPHRGSVNASIHDLVNQLRSLCRLMQCGDGNDQRVDDGSSEHGSSSERAALQCPRGVGNLNVHGDRSRRRIDCRAETRNAPLESLPVGEKPHRLAAPYAVGLLLRHGSRELQNVITNHSEQFTAGGNMFARLGKSFFDRS